MKLTWWMTCRWLSLNDALAAIEGSSISSHQTIAKYLGEFLERYDDAEVDKAEIQARFLVCI